MVVVIKNNIWLKMLSNMFASNGIRAEQQLITFKLLIQLQQSEWQEAIFYFHLAFSSEGF